jgi:TRAP-type C4-dicarboxylate transport system substrate-binding protein
MNRTTRRNVLRAGGAALIGTGLTPRTAFSQARELRMGTPYPHGSNMHEGLLKFAETVAADSKGRIKINVFTDSQIGDIQQLITGLQLGSIDLAMSGMGNISLFKGGGAFNVGAVPYLFRSKTAVEAIVNGPVFASIREDVVKGSGVRLLTLGGARSARALQTVRGPVLRPEDVKDMRLRVPPVELYRAMFAKLGAKAVPTGLSDVYLALSKGQVEGQDNGFDISLPFKWHEVAKFWSATDHSFETNGWYMNEKLFQSFPEEDRNIFLKAAKAGGEVVTRLGEEFDAKGVEAVKALGVTYTKPDLGPWRQACADVHKPYEGKMWPEGLVEKIRNLPENA